MRQAFDETQERMRAAGAELTQLAESWRGISEARYRTLRAMLRAGVSLDSAEYIVGVMRVRVDIARAALADATEAVFRAQREMGAAQECYEKAGKSIDQAARR